MPDFLAPIDLNKNELQNMRLQNLASAPENPVEGQQYFDTTEKVPKSFNGTSWEVMGGGTGDMTKAVYDTDENDIVDKAETLDDGAGNTATAEDVKNAVSASHAQNTDTGTTSGTFQLDSGNSGPKFKNNAGEVQLRNAADDDYADLRVKNLSVEGTTTTINSETVEIGDSILELNRDVAAAAHNSDGGLHIKRLAADNITRADGKIIFNNSTGRWELTHGPTDDVQTHAAALKYSVAIGDGIETSLVVTHNLNTRDVTVTVRETGSPYAVVFPDIEMTSVDTITVKFATAPTENQYTVVVVG